MYYKIYPDVVFLVNLLMDYLVLAVWSRLCCITTTYARLLLASAVGAAWGLAAEIFTEIPEVAGAFVTYFGAGFLMTYIVGLRGRAIERVKGILLLYAVVIFAGGLLSLVGKDSMGTLKTSALCVLIYQGAVPLSRIIKRYVVHRNLLYTVELESGGRKLTVKGLYDTGNSLSDPYNGRPVCVAEKKLIEELDCGIVGDNEAGIRYIPYRSLGRTSGIMRLVTIDSMTINHDGRRELYIRPELAVYEGRLTAAGEYRLIINSMYFCQSREYQESVRRS